MADNLTAHDLSTYRGIVRLGAPLSAKASARVLDRIEADARRIAELEDDAKYLGQRTVQMHRQAMERAREAEAERDAALARERKLRETVAAIRALAIRGGLTRQQVVALCTAVLADTEEAKSDG